MKGESREAVLLALAVTDLLKEKNILEFCPIHETYLVTGAFLPTDRAV